MHHKFVEIDYSSIRQRVSQRLRAAREEAGLTLEAAARLGALGISIIVKCESGRIDVPLGRVIHLAAIYGSDTQTILSGLLDGWTGGEDTIL